MKTSILNVVMSGLIGLLPISVNAAPKKEAKSGGASAESKVEARKSAPQRTTQQAQRKASSQPKRTASQAPKARSTPKQTTRKSPATSQQRRVASSEKSPQRTVERKQAASNVKRQAASRNVERGPAKERADLPQTRQERDVARSSVDQKVNGNRSRATGRADVAERQGGGVDRQRENVDRREGRPDVVGQNDVLNQRERGPRDPAERNSETRAGRAGRDLTVNDLNRDRNRAGRQRTARELASVDRRPARNSNALERERQIARNEVRRNVARERRREIAQVQQQNGNRVRQFQSERQTRAAAVQQQRQALRAERSDYRGENLAASRSEIREYWGDRGDEVRYRVGDRRDYLFDDNWWGERRWRNGPILVSNPWWWWQPAPWASVNLFIGAGWAEPILYDYGTDVIWDDAAVYVHGEPWGTPVEYSQRVVQVANPGVDVIAEAPVAQEEWTPMGVWALVQEKQGDAVMFFQISVSKQGLIRGAYANVVSGEELPIVGQVDRKTQRAAWHIGDEKEKVFEAGIANLAEKEASCLVHMAPGEMQNWLLVRLESPQLPDRPVEVSSNLR